MSLTGKTTEEQIWNYLSAAGMTDAGVAGLMGNLYAESGLIPNNLQNSCEKKLGYTDTTYTAAVDSGAYTNFAKDSAGYGLAQWTYWSRKEALLAYAKAAGKSIGDLEMQLGFLMQELSSSYKAVLSMLKTATTVKPASDSVLVNFECPADQSNTAKTKRAGYSQTYYDKYATTGGTTNVSTVKTAAELVAKAKNIAENYDTTYMLGPWGWPTTQTMIDRACNSEANGAKNKTWLSYANAIKGKGFIFDCVGLIKGILWGWSGDLSKNYGGAGYACNGVPDIGADTMITKCAGVSTDFSNIVPGEVVWMSGHIGIYIGDGVVVESTPRWKWGVQKSTILNVVKSQVAGTVGTRTWTKHGKLPYIAYPASTSTADTGTVATAATATTEKKATEAAKSKDTTLAGTYVVTAASGLHIRNGAGTGKASMAVLPKGAVVRNYGYYTAVGAVKWLYVQVTYQGIKYTGFCSAEYLSKQ